VYFHQVINGRDAITRVIAACKKIPIDDPLHEVIIREWEPPGSDIQINAVYMLYRQIAKRNPEDDEHGWRRYCKYHIGVPILLSDKSKTEIVRSRKELLSELLSHYPLPAGYERRVALMDFVDVVSVMSRDQRRRYIDGILKHPPFLPLQLKIEKRNGVHAAVRTGRDRRNPEYGEVMINDQN